MIKLRLPVFVFICLFTLNFFSVQAIGGEKNPGNKAGNLLLGWSKIDLSPEVPVLLKGQFPARVSEGILDSITATALAIESSSGLSSGKVILISCDLISIDDANGSAPGNNLLDLVRSKLKKSLPEINPNSVILNATHTHTAPYISNESGSKNFYGVELEALSPAACMKYVSERLEKVAIQAWNNRKPGGISFGLGYAVVGHNRVQVDFAGKARIYGETNRPEFSHIEGNEDHSVNLLYTWDTNSQLTGVAINVPCPSQVTEDLYQISADYWHDTRVELTKRLGKGIYFLPQCSSAGDQTPHLMIYAKAEERMQRLMNEGSSIPVGRKTIGHRRQLAIRIADAVTSVLPYMKSAIEWSPRVEHQSAKVELKRMNISINQVDSALKVSDEWKVKYEKLSDELIKNPDLKKKQRWYNDITEAYRKMRYGIFVKERFELEKRQPRLPVELHVVRLGDIVFATNPFELFLDFGLRIKARSPATQTFLVQLAGSGPYLAPSRSVAGGSYGAQAASNLVDPQGGQELVEKSLEMINAVWQEK